MTDFRKVYKAAADEIVQPHMDAHSVFDEARRRRVRKKRMLQKGATIASVVVLIGVGGFTTAKAAGYLGSIIRVGEHGFVSGDIFTMTETFPGTGEDGEQDAQPAMLDSMEESEACTAEVMEIEEFSEQQFDSVEAFQAACPEAVIALPRLTENEESSEMVCVIGDSIYVQYFISEDQSVNIQRYDYGEYEGHAASISFCSEVCNQRSYTTKQGFTYTLIDEVAQADDEEQRIHAAVSVESYEVYVNFYGYEEEEAVRILESMDLSVYCKDR